MSDPITIVNPRTGDTQVVPSDQVGRWAGYVVETPDARANRVGEAQLDADTSAVGAAQQGAARTLTGGLTDVAARAGGGEDAARQLARNKAAHPLAAGAGEIGGAILGTAIGEAPSLPSLAGRAGASLGESLGGGLAARAVGGAVEGGIYGAGQGVSELALSDDPVTVEHAVSAISSNMLYGGALGGAFGAAGGAFEQGLAKARGAIDAASAARETAAGLPEDLAGLDAKGLKGASKTELDAIEQGRVPQRAGLADDLTSFRGDLKDQKLWLATKGGVVDAAGEEIPGVRAIGKRALDADRTLDRLIDNPYTLAEKPQRALEALQKQQAAFEDLLEKEPKLRAAFAADETGTRAAALDNVPAALERNKALQGRIRELVAEPASARLSAIRDAQDALTNAPKDTSSLLKTMVGGGTFSAVSGAMHALPIPGSSLAAHLVGGKAAQMVTDLVFGGLGKATSEGAAKLAATAEAIGGAAKTVALPTATATLSRLRYGASEPEPVNPGRAGKPKLDELYAKRVAEVKSQTAYDATGVPRMRPETRQAMASVLAPIRAVAPVLADRLETAGARRIEYLSSILPRQPDTMQIGPNTWKPSEMEMRSWARRAAAAEDPAGVEERVVHGAVSPEDVEAYRAVYPERAQAFETAVMAKLASAKKPPSFERRLALSMFTGRPIDPAMDPRVLSVLQSAFASEPGTEGGTQGPQAQARFGSIKKSVPSPTPAQSREQGASS